MTHEQRTCVSLPRGICRLRVTAACMLCWVGFTHHHHCLSQFVLNKVRAITGRGLTLTQVFHGGDSGSQVVGEAANRSSREEAATGRWRPQESGGGLAALDDSLENLATPVLRRAWAWWSCRRQVHSWHPHLLPLLSLAFQVNQGDQNDELQKDHNSNAEVEYQSVDLFCGSQLGKLCSGLVSSSADIFSCSFELTLGKCQKVVHTSGHIHSNLTIPLWYRELCQVEVCVIFDQPTSKFGGFNLCLSSAHDVKLGCWREVERTKTRGKGWSGWRQELARCLILLSGFVVSAALGFQISTQHVLKLFRGRVLLWSLCDCSWRDLARCRRISGSDDVHYLLRRVVGTGGDQMSIFVTWVCLHASGHGVEKLWLFCQIFHCQGLAPCGLFRHPWDPSAERERPRASWAEGHRRGNFDPKLRNADRASRSSRRNQGEGLKTLFSKFQQHARWKTEKLVLEYDR